MNIRQFLKNNRGRHLRIRPLPIVIENGRHRPAYDERNLWAVDTDSAGKLRIRNICTDHVKVIGFDNAHEFREPDFLLLKAQLIFKGNSLLIEPLPAGFWGIPS